MRTSVRQWCRTLLGGCRYWIWASRPSEPTCSEYARAACKPVRDAAWTQACILPFVKCYSLLSGAMVPVK